MENIEDLQYEHGQIALATVIIDDFSLFIKERPEEKNIINNNSYVLFQLFNNIKVASEDDNLVKISPPKMKIVDESLILQRKVNRRYKKLKPYEDKSPQTVEEITSILCKAKVLISHLPNTTSIIKTLQDSIKGNINQAE